jgi:hypothetical protein
MWRAFGRPLMALLSPSSIARCNDYRRREVEVSRCTQTRMRNQPDF